MLQDFGSKPLCNRDVSVNILMKSIAIFLSTEFAQVAASYNNLGRISDENVRSAILRLHGFFYLFLSILSFRYLYQAGKVKVD